MSEAPADHAHDHGHPVPADTAENQPSLAAGWWRRLQPGLTARIVMPVLLAALTGLALVVMVIAPNLQERTIAQARTDAQLMLQSLAITLVDPLLGGREPTIFAILDRVAEGQPDWKMIRLTDSDGLQVYPRSAITLPEASARLSRHSAPIRFSTAEIGRIDIVHDLGPLKDSVRAEAMMLAGMMGAMLFLVVLWSAHSLRRGVIQPLLGLRRAADALARHDYDARLPPQPPHEIGALIQSFGAMRAQLVDAQRSSLARRNAELGRLLNRERALRRDAQLLEQVVRNTNAGIAIVDCDSARRPIRSMNAAFSALTGLAGADPAGHDLQSLLHFESEDDLARLLGRRGHGGHGLVGEARIRGREGVLTECYVELSTARIDDPQEQQEIIAVILRDVTRRRAAEVALRGERDRAREESEQKSRFVAAVSHELRTPMTAITGLADLLIDSGLSAEQREHVETILGASTALVDVINDVLDFSKLEAGHLDPRQEPVDLRALLSAVAQLLEPLAGAKGIALSTSVDGAVPQRITGDAGRIRQCLLNLAGNAIKFTDSGSARLTASMKDGMLALSVTDTGNGIGPDDIDHVFKPFRQAGQTSARAPGTGLGLAITAALTEAMGGSVSVTSTLGEGSTFTLTLPVRDAAPPENGAEPVAEPSPRDAAVRPPQPATDGAAPADPAPADLGDRAILVVDDNETNRLVLARMLRANGASVTLAADGLEALEYLAGHRPDLVLMDVSMPRLDGLVATRRLRGREAEEGLAPLTVLALSAGASEDDRRSCMEAGMDGFVAKPVRKAALLAHCAAALEGRALLEPS